ncbi:MAG: DUF2059 domain-containing protein [Marinovum sp.]|nr:DUF2059 domain-containing protein [Marinovum sp.]
MRKLLTATSLCLALAAPAYADVEEDLDYLVEQQVNRTMFEAALTAQRPLIIGALENEFRNMGMSVSDMDHFFDIFIDEFIEEFTETMQVQAREIYAQAYTEQEIIDIAAFLRTPSGQAMIAKTPELMQQGAAHGQIAGMRAGENAMPRVMQRIEREGIEFETPGILDQLRRSFDL